MNPYGNNPDRARNKQRERSYVIFAIGLILVLFWIWQRVADVPPDSSGPSGGATSSASPNADGSSHGSDPDTDPDTGLPVIAERNLPEEARTTLRLIDSKGPFRHDEDGQTFQNRERILPQHERGYYREYTVETPGSSDRGARRIVTGGPGEAYWTSDHYRSFSVIERSAK